MNMSWFECGYCNLRCFMENPTKNKRRSKVCNTHIFKLVYAPKGPFHERGQCNYIKILNYNFSLRLLCEYFMIRIMKVLLKCCSMAIECANLMRLLVWLYMPSGVFYNFIFFATCLKQLKGLYHMCPL
jgi:hypothetical protein